MLLKFFVLVLFLNQSSGDRKSYANYTLFRTIPSSLSHVDFLQSLEKEVSLEFWMPPVAVNKSVDFIVGPESKGHIQSLLDEKQYNYTVTIEDLQSIIDNQTVKSYVRRNMATFNWKNYFRLKDIYDWLRDLEAKYPKEVTLIEIGRTFENRPILAVKVLLSSSATMVRSTVFVEGGIHAREWISISLVTYLLNQVISHGHGPESSWKNLAHMYEWYFIPVMNPDGYEYSHTNDRLWRKNRQGGFGVDINRNFDAAFDIKEKNNEITSSTYMGKFPFSERESAALAKFLRSKHETVEYYLAFHSYGQYIILPYAHSKLHLANYDEVARVLKDSLIGMRKKYNTRYLVGTAYDTVGYTTSGVSGCWAKAAFNIRYVATFELRDTGYYGFVLPTHYILPTCQETIDCLERLLKPRHENFSTLRHDQNNPHFYDGNGETTLLVCKNLIVANIFMLIAVTCILEV